MQRNLNLISECYICVVQVILWRNSLKHCSNNFYFALRQQICISNRFVCFCYIGTPNLPIETFLNFFLKIIFLFIYSSSCTFFIAITGLTTAAGNRCFLILLYFHKREFACYLEDSQSTCLCRMQLYHSRKSRSLPSKLC